MEMIILILQVLFTSYPGRLLFLFRQQELFEFICYHFLSKFHCQNVISGSSFTKASWSTSSRSQCRPNYGIGGHQRVSIGVGMIRGKGSLIPDSVISVSLAYTNSHSSLQVLIQKSSKTLEKLSWKPYSVSYAHVHLTPNLGSVNYYSRRGGGEGGGTNLGLSIIPSTN